MAMPDGTPVEVSGTFSDPGAGLAVRDDLRIDGAQGGIAFDGTTLRLMGGRPEERVYVPETVYADSYASAIAHFADALARGIPFETSGEENLATLALVEDAYRLAGGG